MREPCESTAGSHIASDWHGSSHCHMGTAGSVNTISMTSPFQLTYPTENWQFRYELDCIGVNTYAIQFWCRPKKKKVPVRVLSECDANSVILCVWLILHSVRCETHAISHHALLVNQAWNWSLPGCHALVVFKAPAWVCRSEFQTILKPKMARKCYFGG